MTSKIFEPYLLTPAIRHDGWTGDVMAKFLETLAETGIVLDACDAAGRSRETAYALRRRNPLFAKAWELALGNARDRLADTLLARSIEGNVEQIIKDGVIVAEKHYLDNRLALAVLKRLDQMFPGAGRGPGQRGNAAPQRLDPGFRREANGPDWDVALTALRTGNEDDIAAALLMLKGDEPDKADTPPIDEIDGDDDGFDHPRIWREFQTDEWRTNYPPPPGFFGHEESDWGCTGYCRTLSDEELAALIAAGIADPEEAPSDVTLEEDEAERAAFFSSIVTPDLDDRPEAESGGLCRSSHGPAFSDNTEDKADAGSSRA